MDAEERERASPASEGCRPGSSRGTEADRTRERPRHTTDTKAGREGAGPHPREVCAAGEKQITLKMGDDRRADDGCDAVQLNSVSLG